MGLLGQILGGLVSGRAAGRGASMTPSGNSGMSPTLMALLPVVLSMLANRSRTGAAADAGDATGGGLGGSGGSGGLGTLAGLGGLGALVNQFTQRGYGMQANSWVGTGTNEPVLEHAIGEVFGEDQVTQIARHAGVSESEARSGLSELLPEVIDHFTPDGAVADADQLNSSVDDYLRGLS